MKRRPSHRQQRKAAKSHALKARIQQWAWILKKEPHRCHLTIDQLLAGKNIPGVPS